MLRVFSRAVAIVLVWGMAAANAAKPVDPPSKTPIPWLLAKISSERHPSLYGTAILFDATAESLFYVTNFHILPRDSKKWNALRLATPIFDYEATEVTVVGTAPGYDIAVLEMKRAPSESAFLKEVIELMPNQFHRKAIDRKKYWVLIEGIPSDPQFRDEVRPAVNIEQWRPSRSMNSVEPFEVTGSRLCPPLFLSHCYILPMRTWGFSGGVMAANVNASHLGLQIAGIVSHFAPLSPLTYVIPIDEALTIAEGLRRNRKVLLNAEVENAFDYIAGNMVKELGAKGKLIRQVSVRETIGGGESSGGGGESSGGGGESSGGGGESSGGGGESSGGGGESSGGGGENRGKWIHNKNGNIGFFGDFDAALRAIRSPEVWGNEGNALTRLINVLPGFRGVKEVLSYHPGVEILEGDKWVQYFSLGESPIPTLQSFLHAPLEAREKRTSEFEKSPLPSRLVIEALPSFGLMTTSALRRLKGPDDGLIEATLNNTSFEFSEIKPLISIHAAEGRRGRVKAPFDILFGLSGTSPETGVKGGRAALQETGGKVHVESTGKYGEGDIVLSGSWKQTGPGYYRLIGKGSISGFKFREDWQFYRETEDLSAFASLQWNAEERLYELKIVLATEDTFNDGRSILAPQGINVYGFYIPLIKPIL